MKIIHGKDPKLLATMLLQELRKPEYNQDTEVRVRTNSNGYLYVNIKLLDQELAFYVRTRTTVGYILNYTLPQRDFYKTYTYNSKHLYKIAQKVKPLLRPFTMGYKQQKRI